MISLFDYKISAISCSAKMFFHKTKIFSRILQQAQQTYIIYDIHNKNFYTKELKLKLYE